MNKFEQTENTTVLNNDFNETEVKFLTPKEAYFIVYKSQREVLAKLMEETFKNGKRYVKLPFTLLNPIAQELTNMGWAVSDFRDTISWQDSLQVECEQEVAKLNGNK